MESFIELTDSEHSEKILVNLKEVTFIQASEKNEGKTTAIHFTSSTYHADRRIEVIEGYDTIKGLIIKAGIMITI